MLRSESAPGGVSGVPSPLGTTAIARVAAAATSDMLRAVLAELYRDPDVDDSHRRIPMPRTGADQVALLNEDYVPGPSERPPAPAPRAAARWVQNTEDAHESIFAEVEHALRARTGGIEIIGAKGDARERLRQAQRCLQEERPFLSLSFTGSLRTLLATGFSHSMSVSILSWKPGMPLAAAVVTAQSALAADCGSAYRLLLPEGDWEQRTEDATRQPADRTRVVLPQGLYAQDRRVRELFDDIHYVNHTGPAVTDAVLCHSVPAAVHTSGDVLDSAVVLAAAAHGFTVRPLREPGPPWQPWQVCERVMRALASGEPLPDLVIGRDEVTTVLVHLLGGTPPARA